MRPSSVPAPLSIAVVALTIGLAGCGGSSGSGDPSSAKYDPSHTTLKDAGLDVCSEADDQIPQTMANGSGLQNARAFFVADDCMGEKTSPDTAMVFQYDSKQAVDAASAKVNAAIPNSSSAKYGPLILVTTGPNRAENLTAIEGALQKTYPTTSSS